MKSFIRGDTTPEGLIITWIDEEQKRSQEEIEFRDYFYITLEDFEEIREQLKLRWSRHLIGVTQVEGKNERDELEFFAKIVLRDNTKKYYLKNWCEEEHDINTYEADLNTTKRYLIDNHKTTELNILNSPYIFYDLETDDRKDFKYDEFNKVVPENTILSFSGTDYKGRTFFFINEDSKDPQCERALLLKIKELFMNYSVTSGWYSDFFDDVYLSGRCAKHKIPDFTKLVNKIDYKFSYEKYRVEISLDNYKLDYVAGVELDEKKIDIKKGGGRLYELYLTDKEKLKEYNIRDTELLYKLNRKLQFIELHLMTAEHGNCNPELTKYNIGSNDYFILMKCKDMGIIAPSNPTAIEKQRRKDLGSIGGGYTRGVPGLYEKAAVYDFGSLYPSLEITYNISPEKFVENITIEDEAQYLEKKDETIKCMKNYEELMVYVFKHNYIISPSDLTYVAKKGREIYHPYRLFKNDSIGLLPSIMIELIEERIAVKKKLEAAKQGMKNIDKTLPEYLTLKIEADRLYNRQLALKYMLNSSYGLNALPAYRFFRFDVADAITAAGKVATKRIRKYAKTLGFHIVFSDTDSIGISPGTHDCPTFEKFDKLLPAFVDRMLANINNEVYEREDEYGIHKHRLILEFEKTYKPLLYKRKKRYAGLIDGVVDITGLKSSQMNVLAAKIQEEFIDDILKGTFSSYTWTTKMAELHRKCFAGEIEEENLYINKKFTARAAEQQRPRAHTKLAERMMLQGLDVHVGDKIKYIVESVKGGQHAVSPEEFRINREYPADYYWGIFISPLISLMGIIKDVNVFSVINVPDIEKLRIKLGKEKDDEKRIKLMERIRKKEEKLINTPIDENEAADFLFEYQIPHNTYGQPNIPVV